jgi:hypothetical protein
MFLFFLVAIVAVLALLVAFWPLALALAIIIIIIIVVRSGGSYSKSYKGVYKPQQSNTPQARKYSKKELLRLRTKNDAPGVYILHNVNRHIYYVGQSEKIKASAKKHFKGTSHIKQLNKDISSGHNFNAVLIPLADTNFENLDNLETHYINQYDAAKTGYN